MSASGPPKCRICHTEHWPRDPHNWPNQPEPKTIHHLPLATNPPALATQLPTTVANKHGKYANLEKRRAYQRILMQQQRAAGKA